MAEGTCPPSIYVSSLDPGVGKTTTLIAFIKQVVEQGRGDVGVLVCLSRLDEISRLVEEAGLGEEDFSVFTSDADINGLSSTPPDQAQILFTTQQMLTRRCSGSSFSACREFHYLGEPRSVRVWDETLEPGQITTLSTDDLGGLLGTLRLVSSELADSVQDLQEQLRAHAPGTVMDVPKLDTELLHQMSRSPRFGDLRSKLEHLAQLSGRPARVLRGTGKQRIALDIRDALPEDIAPLLVLDASGRVRKTYSQWETHKGGLVRLPPAPKNYGPLTIHVLDQGGGKDSWQQNADTLAREVATLIDTKPDEEWLVVHHKDARGVDPKAEILRWLSTDKARVHFIHWGAHQATNAYKHISNVILAGTLFMPESQYVGLAYASTGLAPGDDLPSDLLKDLKLGEHGHGILQALCRASVRGSDGERCLPCNAYVVVSKGSGVRQALPVWFPGCKVKTWKPRHKPLKGQVREAVAYIERRVSGDPATVVYFSELMDVLGITNKSNFNRTIRKREDFQAAIQRLGLQEVSTDGRKHMDALQRVWLPDDKDNPPEEDTADL